MRRTEIAKRFFKWNAKNLVHSAHLKKSEIGDFFAESFQVNANGRTYKADFDNYFDFLNGFRLTIQSINYDFHDFIEDKHHVVISFTAHILRVDEKKETFEAILILKFDQNDKIVLWHEVYIEIGSTPS
ncbi:MAG: hypothetical protein K1X28_01275 [Parachlamydiales bacterium]|nr:hypothetical protein [Parachlamydiales bacterium]